MPKKNKYSYPPLVKVNTFQQDSPINLRWAIHKHRDEMISYGALVRFGRNLLINPPAFWAWVSEHQEAK